MSTRWYYFQESDFVDNMIFIIFTDGNFKAFDLYNLKETHNILII